MNKDIAPFRWHAALPQHHTAIKKLILDILQEYGLKQGAVDDCLNDIDLHYFQKGGFFGVLLNEKDQLIATAGLCPIDDQAVEIRKMYLHSAFRGQGLGKYIVRDLIIKARNLGFLRLELETASVLKEAIALYKSFGFVPFVSDHLSERCDQAFRLVL